MPPLPRPSRSSPRSAAYPFNTLTPTSFEQKMSQDPKRPSPTSDLKTRCRLQDPAEGNASARRMRQVSLNGPAPNHRYEVSFIRPQGGSSALLGQCKMPPGLLSTNGTRKSFGTLPPQQITILENPEAQTALFRLGNQRLEPPQIIKMQVLVFPSSAGFPFGAYATDRLKGKGFGRRTHPKLLGVSSPIFRNSWSNGELCFQPSTAPAALR